MLTRRDLFLGAGAAMVFRSDTLKVLEGLAPPQNPADAARDEAYWAGVRKAFHVESRFLYLNNGGICPTGDQVLDASFNHIRDANLSPAYQIYRRQEKEIEEVRKRLAKLFHCDAEEIAIMPNASQGLFTSILGAPAAEGDLFLGTDQDYPRVITALHQRERRDKIRFEQAAIPAVPKDVGALISPFEPFAEKRPNLVSIPRVGFLNGTLFPAKEVCAMSRKAGALSLVDGAHGIGHLDDSPEALGCDLYACCLHKWILGPLGTGFLYVRKAIIKEIWPLYPADPGLDGDIRKFEQFGTRNTGIVLAIKEALDAHEAIGTDRKSARLEYLRQYWTSRLAEVKNIHFSTALNPELSRVLTTVTIEGIVPGSLADWLFSKKGIFVTTAVRGDIQGIRVTPQVFTTLSELDRLIAALREAAASGIN